MQDQMGIGRVGMPGVLIKRKFRWTFSIQTPCGKIPEHYVKVAARPKLNIESTELNYLNATTWMPGKAKWEPITVKWIDVATSEMQGLWDWVATLYNFQKSEDLPMSEKRGWAGVGVLKSFSARGDLIERWTIKSMFPEMIDFGDLAYEDNGEMTIEMSLRYSDVFYEGFCGNPTPVGCGVGCS